MTLPGVPPIFDSSEDPCLLVLTRGIGSSSAEKEPSDESAYSDIASSSLGDSNGRSGDATGGSSKRGLPICVALLTLIIMGAPG